MTNCGCFAGSTPESVPVTINNNTFNISLGDVGARWIDLTFEDEDSANAGGLIFVLADGATEYQVQDETEVLVTIDNVVQETSVYAVTDGGTSITLTSPLTDGPVLRVRALAKEV
jgi:hypothetical protein